MNKLVRFGPIISFGLFGGIIGVCGFHPWNWQFWALDIGVALCMFTSHMYGKKEDS